MITFQMTVPAEVVSHFGFLKKEANLPPRANAVGFGTRRQLKNGLRPA
jgi:hypothetical protein